MAVMKFKVCNSFN